MADKMKYDRATMEQAQATFGKAHEQVQDVTQEVLSIANTIEEALKGDAGSEFVDVLTGMMAPSLAKLAAKMTEIQGDIKNAMAAMDAADSGAKGTF